MLAFEPLLAWLMQSLIALVFVFGVGIDAPRRYRARIASVKSSFFRRSGVRNAETKAVSTDPPATNSLGTGRRRAGTSSELPVRGPAQANSQRVIGGNCDVRSAPRRDFPDLPDGLAG